MGNEISMEQLRNWAQDMDEHERMEEEKKIHAENYSQDQYTELKEAVLDGYDFIYPEGKEEEAPSDLTEFYSTCVEEEADNDLPSISDEEVKNEVSEPKKTEEVKPEEVIPDQASVKKEEPKKEEPKKEEPKKEEPKKEEPKKEEAVKKERSGYTRVDAFCEGVKKGGTVKEISERSEKIYERHGGIPNEKQSIGFCKLGVKFLVGIGYLSSSDAGKYTLVN